MGSYRMLASISGTRNGQDWPKRGEVVDLDDGEAGKYVRAGLMAPQEAAVETAVAGDVETATTQRKRGRGAAKDALTVDGKQPAAGDGDPQRAAGDEDKQA